LKKILVTGAAGFMGSWIAEDLATLKSHKVVGTDIAPPTRYGKSKPPYEFVLGDLRDREFVVRLAKRVKPQLLIHLASNAREGASQFQPYSSTSNNMGAYANVLEQCIKGGVKKVVLFSSMSVYGDQTPPFDESMPRKPVDVYAVNKAAKEQMTEILAKTYGFVYTIIRPHNVYGEWQNLKDRYRNVIAIFMNSIMNNEPIYVHGDGSQKRAFSYILDSLPCYRKLVLEDFPKEVFNIGGNVEISINDIADRVIRAMGKKKWKVIHTASRPGEVKDAWCTTTKSEKLLGYKEEYGLDTGIDRMARWAIKVGPVSWTEEKLELRVADMPAPWR
jgi:UDP-glucose 4-epimerase